MKKMLDSLKMRNSFLDFYKFKLGIIGIAEATLIT